MTNRKRTKRYPRNFLRETQKGEDGYPLYRRRQPEDGEFTANINVRSVHLENGQRAYFTSANAIELAQAPQETALTSFFRICIEDEFARTLLYHQVPKYYTWDNVNKKWNRRKIGNNVPDHPGINSNLKSFQELGTVEGRLCKTYKEACQVRGLLENDEHWNATLEEATVA
ncbi:uncharacterized protein LOC118180959 [Stegodyphus dumicola]|uniref:uncharacterized protein LOC118180959 n=1 Tax=Stegodyphus dumicola TaxID=202533 RepID=UPI0015ACF251|nr:uncharacterized protein LOC118180959 [Stegodyphus dumicola]